MSIARHKTTLVIEEFLNDVGWDDEIVFDVADRTAIVHTGLTINGQRFKLYIISFEAEDRLAVYLYAPLNVPPQRMSETALLLNFINVRVGLGRFAFDDTEVNCQVQFKAILDVEEATVSLRQLHILVAAANWAMEEFMNVISEILLTDQSAVDLWRRHRTDEWKDIFPLAPDCDTGKAPSITHMPDVKLVN